MNCVISIINPNGLNILQGICDKLDIPLSLILHGHGTADKSILDILRIESKERRVVITVTDREKTDAFIKEQRRRLYIDAPGNGIIITIPMKSVGGGKTLAFLSGGQAPKGMPELNYEYELIVAIANEGYADTVMDAARTAGAAGGTVLHGNGTGAKHAEKFYNVVIAQEKEVILIVSTSAQKTEIMSAILKGAGPASDAGAIVFSLPVSALAGFGLIQD